MAGWEVAGLSDEQYGWSADQLDYYVCLRGLYQNRYMPTGVRQRYTREARKLVDDLQYSRHMQQANSSIYAAQYIIELTRLKGRYDRSSESLPGGPDGPEIAL